jgi:adenosine kinase
MTDINVAVLGPIPHDRITTHKGEKAEKYGCSTYTAAAISSLASDSSTIHVVSHVRKQDYEPIKELLKPFGNLDLSHLSFDADQGDVIDLVYTSHNRRKEKQTGYMAPILPADVEGLLHCDAFVFVPITDFEVPLETLRYIKQNSDGVIIFDGHGPTNGCSMHGDRFHKFWIDRDRWLPYIDVLKMNLEEARCSWFEGDYDFEDSTEADQLTLDVLPKFAQHCLDKGVKALYVTLDQLGCVVYFRNDAGRIREHLVKRVRVENVVDTTGCGDSFAGGLAFGYLQSGDFVKACQFGNCSGAQRCAGIDLSIYKDLAGTEAQIEETYGD